LRCLTLHPSFTLPAPSLTLRAPFVRVLIQFVHEGCGPDECGNSGSLDFCPERVLIADGLSSDDAYYTKGNKGEEIFSLLASFHSAFSFPISTRQMKPSSVFTITCACLFRGISALFIARMVIDSMDPSLEYHHRFGKVCQPRNPDISISE